MVFFPSMYQKSFQRGYSQSRFYRKKPIWKDRQTMYPRGRTQKQLLDYAVRGVSMMKGLVNAERKFHDVTLAKAVSAAGTVDGISFIAAGDDATERNGNSINAKTLLFRAQLSNPVTVGFTGSSVRLLVVKDTMQQGTAPSPGDILESVDILSPININNISRFQVIIDDLIPMWNNTTANAGNTIVQDRKYFRKLDFHVKYAGTAGTDTNKNNLYSLLVNSGNQTVNVSYYSRLTFYDN